jgi:hypothetical protein
MSLMAQLIGQIHPKKIHRKGPRGYGSSSFMSGPAIKNNVSAFVSFDDVLTHFFGEGESWTFVHHLHAAHRRYL